MYNCSHLQTRNNLNTFQSKSLTYVRVKVHEILVNVSLLFQYEFLEYNTFVILLRDIIEGLDCISDDSTIY